MACRNRKGWRRTGPTPFVTSLDLDLIFDFYADHADPSCERGRTMLQVPQCVKGAHDGKKYLNFQEFLLPVVTPFHTHALPELI